VWRQRRGSGSGSVAAGMAWRIDSLAATAYKAWRIAEIKRQT